MFYSVQTFFWILRLYKELLTCLYQHHVTGNGFSEKHHLSQVESESGQFVWLDSFPKHLSICIFFLIINMSHLMQFSNISNLRQKDIPENWSDFIYFFIFLYPLSYFFFLFCFDQNMLISYGFAWYPWLENKQVTLGSGINSIPIPELIKRNKHKKRKKRKKIDLEHLRPALDD